VTQSIKVDALPQKQRERALLILQAASEVFARDGYASFTLRRIADEAGVQLKSLQRLFPTKQALLDTVIDHVLHSYYNWTFDPQVSAEDNLTAFVDYMLCDLRDPFTARFFPELWALGGRDDRTGEAMDELYAEEIGRLTEMVQRVNAELSPRTARLRATMIAMSIEGLILMIGSNRPNHADHEGLVDEVKMRILDIVLAPST
jgi:AcrR family transcriptional regulator